MVQEANLAEAVFEAEIEVETAAGPEEGVGLPEEGVGLPEEALEEVHEVEAVEIFPDTRINTSWMLIPTMVSSRKAPIPLCPSYVIAKLI